MLWARWSVGNERSYAYPAMCSVAYYMIYYLTQKKSLCHGVCVILTYMQYMSFVYCRSILFYLVTCGTTTKLRRCVARYYPKFSTVLSPPYCGKCRGAVFYCAREYLIHLFIYSPVVVSTSY